MIGYWLTTPGRLFRVRQGKWGLEVQGGVGEKAYVAVTNVAYANAELVILHPVPIEVDTGCNYQPNGVALYKRHPDGAVIGQDHLSDVVLSACGECPECFKWGIISPTTAVWDRLNGETRIASPLEREVV